MVRFEKEETVIIDIHVGAAMETYSIVDNWRARWESDLV